MHTAVAEALRSGHCPSDSEFDQFLPVELQTISRRHFTPLVVVARAAEWLAEHGVRTIVDIGSGAGKFCVAAALAKDFQVTGFEQRQGLVTSARELAKLFGVDDRVRFMAGTLGSDPVPVAEAYYMFNPFGENVCGQAGHIDESVELGLTRYRRDIKAMENFLEHAPVGTYVITYAGFGSVMPDAFAQLLVDREMPNVLRLWRKVIRSPARTLKRPRRSTFFDSDSAC